MQPALCSSALKVAASRGPRLAPAAPGASAVRRATYAEIAAHDRARRARLHAGASWSRPRLEVGASGGSMPAACVVVARAAWPDRPLVRPEAVP